MRSNERKRSEVEFNLDEMWEEIVNGVADSSEDSQLWNLIMKEKKTSKKSSQQVLKIILKVLKPSQKRK